MAALDNVYIAVHLVLARRQMVVHFDMDLNPTVPIRILKEEMVAQLQMPVSQQQWYFHNIVIRDDHSLEHVGVVNDSIVEVRPAPAPALSGSAAPLASSSSSSRDAASGYSLSRQVD